MRIVNRETFLKLPAGTLFYKYSPQILGELSVKGEAGWDPDFVYLSLNDLVDAKDSGEHFELLDKAEAGADIPVAFENFGRDGLFDADQLFAVLSKDEARMLVAFLKEVIDAGRAQ